MKDRFAMRVSTSNVFHRSLAAAATVAMMGSGCGKEAPPAAPPAPIVDAAPATPPAPESKLADATAWDTTTVTSDNVGQLTALADTLAGENTPEAKSAALRLRLQAVTSFLGAAAPAGFDVEAQLRMVIVQAEAGGEADAGLGRAARVLMRSSDVRGAEPFDTEAVRTAATADSFEADIYRTVARRGLASLKEGLRDASTFDAIARRYGNFVCPGCHQLGALGYEAATKAAAEANGLKCADDDARPLCATQREVIGIDPVHGEVANMFAAAIFGSLGELAALPVSHKGLATTVPAGSGARAVAFPVIADLKRAPVVGAQNGAPAVVVPAGRLVVRLDFADVGLGVWGTIGANGTSPAAAGKLLPSSDGMVWEALAAENGADLVKARLAALTPDGPGADEIQVALAVDAALTAEKVATALDMIVAAGLDNMTINALRTGATHPLADQIPFVVRDLPAEAAKALGTSPAREIIVVVGANSIEIWGPETGVEAAEGVQAMTPVGEDRAASLPTGFEPGWRGANLARLVLPRQPLVLPEGATAVDPTTQPASLRAADELTSKLVEAVTFWRDATGAGPVVHIVAAANEPAGHLVDLARAVQEAPTKAPLASVADVWPGATCVAAGCPGQVAVVWSKRAAPSAKGLTPAPKAGGKPAKPVGPKPEAASPEFCNTNDIAAQMKRNTSRFRFCYEKELQLAKELGGRIQARFTIGLNGNVSSVSASGDLGDAGASKNVRSCIERELSKVAFAKPDGGACLVNWPFMFRGN